MTAAGRRGIRARSAWSATPPGSSASSWPWRATCSRPPRVVVVGAMAEAGELVLGPIRAALQRNIAPNEPPDLVLGALGTRHTALGAIALALDETDWLPAAARPA